MWGREESIWCPSETSRRGSRGTIVTVGLSGSPRDANRDCTTVAVAPVLPVGYVISASRIADRRVILAGYRLADLLTRGMED